MKKIKNILVATDFSSPSKVALDEAAMLAEKFKATVYLLNTVENITECAVDYCLSEEQLLGTRERMLSDSRKKLNAEIKRIRGKGIRATIIPEVRYGHTLEEILAEESDRNVDLLVVGPHERKSSWRRLAAHLTDKLIVKSRCDTLAVKPAV